MTLAPTVVFVHNRPRHTIKTLTALEHNDLARESELFIFSDGPRTPNDRSKVAEVRKIIRAGYQFKNISIVENTTNRGLSGSIISGVREVVEEYGRVIVLEDDLVTSPHFLRFMNQALDFYQSKCQVFSISGFNLPRSVMKIPVDYNADVYFNPRSSSWGWATWKDRWQLADWEVEQYERFLTDRNMQKGFNRGGDDLTSMLVDQMEGRVDSWSIRWSFSHFTNHAVAVYPVISYVDNIGRDGSGTHRFSNKYLRNDLSEAKSDVRFIEENDVNPGLIEAFRKIYEKTPLDKMREQFKIGFANKTYRCGKLRTLLVNKRDISGGAARAANRLHHGLLNIGVHSQMLVNEKDGAEDNVLRRQGAWPPTFSNVNTRIDRAPLRLYPGRSVLPWSLNWFPNGIHRQINRINPDIVHLHWIGRGQIQIAELSKIHCPIVWTLHDMWAFTGGCHYDGECGKYKVSCGNCPQLQSSFKYDLSRCIWKAKRHYWKDLNLTIVTPSNWLAQCARASSLFGGVRVETIPNGLDLDVYKPKNKQRAREMFGFPIDRHLILFGAMDATSDDRKGFEYLSAALKSVAPQLKDKAELVVFGDSEPKKPPDFGMKANYIGRVDDDFSLRTLYSCADVTLAPSIQDNLPNVVAESLACGTPVLGFAVGGIPDMIKHQQNGYLAEPFLVDDFCDGIIWCLGDKKRHHGLCVEARAGAAKNYEIQSISERYRSLYKSILGR